MPAEQKLKDLDPVNAAQFAAAATFEERRYEYLVARRDQLLDRLRFGFLALNGASLLALLGALGGKGEAAVWLGFNAERARYSAIAFAFGTVCAGLSILREANLFRMEAADAFARQSQAKILSSLYEANADKTQHDRAGEAMRDYHALAAVDFQYSVFATVFQNAAAALWLFGVLVPLFATLGWWR